VTPKGRATTRQRARKRFRMFVDREPSRLVDYPTPDVSTLALLGQVTEISYRSDKFDGVEREYVHKFDGDCHLATTGDGKYLVVFSVKKPPRTLVKPEGIVG